MPECVRESVVWEWDRAIHPSLRTAAGRSGGELHRASTRIARRRSRSRPQARLRHGWTNARRPIANGKCDGNGTCARSMIAAMKYASEHRWLPARTPACSVEASRVMMLCPQRVTWRRDVGPGRVRLVNISWMITRPSPVGRRCLDGRLAGRSLER